MRRCRDTLWLDFDRHGQDTALLESDRLRALTKGIPNPDFKQPSFFVLIGNTTKVAALRELFGIKKTRRLKVKQASGLVHLHIQASSIFSERPIYIADSDLCTDSSNRRAPNISKCHEITRKVLRKKYADGTIHSPIVGQMVDDICTRLLFPFVDIFCLFSNDLGGLSNVVRHLAVWLEIGHSSNLPPETYPRVLIVTEEVTAEAQHEMQLREEILRMLTKVTVKNFFEQFSAIDVVALHPCRILSTNARYRRLKERLMSGSDPVRESRVLTRTLFSVTHFTAFLRHACDHFAAAYEKPFSFINASRRQNPVAVDLDEHLSNFMAHIHSIEELTNLAAPVLASSFMLDSYPPDCHVFDPSPVFHTLYKDVLYRACKEKVIAFEGSGDMILRSGFIKMVEKFMHAFFKEYLQRPQSSASIHLENLRNLRDWWPTIQSTNTCFSCLRRRPQYELSCGHCVCENCVMIFGKSSAVDPSIFKVFRCFLCETVMQQEVIVKVQPPTAGVGILSIDGGGTRGVVPLKLMKRIQDRVQALTGLQTPLPKFCKLAFGVSSGGLIVLALYINGWSVEKCIESFENLAHVAFKPRSVLRLPFVSHMQELATSVLADGLYPAENIDSALKEVFGTDKNILDPSYATTIGARVGIPVATIQDSSYCMFTNYNGVGIRSANQGYDTIRPKDPHGRIPIWEIARAASAAQGIFPVKEISGIGAFQDPGTLENNPLISALAEAKALFPCIKNPDFVISLGTGAPKLDVPNTEGLRSLWKDGAFRRLFRLAWEKMRDRRVWHAVKDNPGFHRLDVEFDNTEPRLDDTKSMDSLKLSVQKNQSISEVVDNISRHLIASLFYFELESMPEKHRGRYAEAGNILCLLPQSDPDFNVLLTYLASSPAYFCVNNLPLPGSVGDQSFLAVNGNFQKRLELDVGDIFTISLKHGSMEACNISGSPYSIDKLVLAQGLDADFGRADHRKRKKGASIDVQTTKRKCARRNPV